VLGNLYIIAAPSGAGKTSLVNALLTSVANVRLSISHTTRPPRPAEREGEHYFFVDETQFQAMVQEQRFLEHARVFDHWYGTSQQWVLDQIHQGFDVILEIDWQGAQQVKQLMAEAIMIFIFPPSCEILAERLRQRGQDKPEVIARRLAEARQEMSHFREYDYLLINDDFATTLAELKAIMVAEGMRQRVQAIKNKELISRLL